MGRSAHPWRIAECDDSASRRESRKDGIFGNDRGGPGFCILTNIFNFQRYPQKSDLTALNGGIRSAVSIGTVVRSSAVVVEQRSDRGVP